MPVHPLQRRNQDPLFWTGHAKIPSIHGARNASFQHSRCHQPLFAGLADRWGRATLVVGGLFVTGFFTLFVLPTANTKWWFTGESFTPKGDSVEVHLEGTLVPQNNA